MRTLRHAKSPNRLVTASFLAAILCGFTLVPPANGQDRAPGKRLPELSHDLEGTQFVGPLRVEGEANPGEDVLRFKDGMFTSRTCREFGFPPAPYWVRRDADGLHFRTKLQSPANGTILFVGVFDGQRMRATAFWTKHRWYWTIEQEILFTGRPANLAE